MLGKLLKHEWKATGRHFLLLYLVFAFVTVCNKLILEITAQNDFLEMFQALFMAAYIITCAAIFILTTLLIVMRFYKNMLSDEGYLTFTLPVTVSQHIAAKGIVAYIWSILSIILFLLSVCLLVSGHGMYDVFYQILELIGYVSEEIGIKFWLCIIIYGIAMLIGNAYSILQYYMSMAIGQLAHKHRILASFGIYFGFTFVLQNVLSVFLLLVNIADPILSLEELESNFLSAFFSYMNAIGIFSILFNIILSIAFFFITRYVLTKKLNLE